MNYDIQETDLAQAIKLRRSTKPDKMNGQVIDDKDVNELLSLADWAPTHARTEPWRFIVYDSAKVKDFTKEHAELFKANTNPESFTQMKYDNLVNLGNNVSHVIIAWMKRIENHKIPEIEEVSATACAVQNILLGATGKGIASFWSTGGMVHNPAFRSFLKLGDEDRVLGVLYLGYSDNTLREGMRMIPLADKIQWVK
ncbi:MAG: nitroreductase [Flavitalea sp.]